MESIENQSESEAENSTSKLLNELRHAARQKNEKQVELDKATMTKDDSLRLMREVKHREQESMMKAFNELCQSASSQEDIEKIKEWIADPEQSMPNGAEELDKHFSTYQQAVEKIPLLHYEVSKAKTRYKRLEQKYQWSVLLRMNFIDWLLFSIDVATSSQSGMTMANRRPARFFTSLQILSSFGIIAFGLLKI